MKVSGLAFVAFAGSASAYSSFTATRSPLNNIGKSNAFNTQSRKVGASIKMEDFGLFRGSKSLDYSGTWEDTDCISEAKMAKLFSDQGLRYKMSKTEEEESQHEPLFGVGPRVANIWEALGFTATSNNEARQQEKLKAIEKCRTTTKGVQGGAGGVAVRAAHLEKYGYPRLPGTGGIFYADQLSTDKVPMRGFNMGKGGVMWPVPENVKTEHYGKHVGPKVDNLPKAKKP